MAVSSDIAGASAARSTGRKPAGLALAVVAVCAVLAACGDSAPKGGGQPSAPKGQVIASVGKDSVTIHELEGEFRRLGVPQDNRPEEVVRRVLGDLVKRKYFAQRAVDAKLDREPGVLMEMLRTREQILATAYLQRDVSTKAAAIGKAEIDRYIASRPLLFGKRLVLTVDQITIPLTDKLPAVIEATKDAKTLEQVGARLSELGVLHNRAMGLMSSGDMPEDAFKIIQEKKAEEVFFVQAGRVGVFFKVVGEEPVPMNADDAARLARQRLVADIFAAEIAKDPATVEIKYEGDYAKIMAKPAPGTPPAGAAAPKTN